MAPIAGCVVGIDGLPLGTCAVVVVDGDIVASFDVVDDAGRAVDLEQRVARAIRRAAELAGVQVGEVRLLFVDDGSAGEHIGRLGERLTSAGLRFHVYDLIGSPDIDRRGDTAVPGRDTDTATGSMARARSVALR
ncbi:MAG: hypothetical protein OEV40_11940 [Acidimicrobiia bacterium]|nr:hypothetical protein [Acidimicrobiia bacterium]